jgi:two-component system, cell cycle sensor histidine kinase and response regulator CckA
VVDDEPAVRSLVTRVLRRDGFVVLDAEGPQAALAVVASHQGDIDLVLTDVSMPGGNGVELVAALAADRPALRVLFISGYDRDGLAGVAEPPADARLLRKPFSVGDLLIAVREMMSGVRLAAVG